MTNRHFMLSLLVLLLAAVALVLVGRYTNIDLYLADAMFDFATQAFPWRDHWFFVNVMHHAMKAFMIGMAMVPIVALIADSVLGKTLLEEKTRRSLWVLAVASILVPLTVSIMKSTSMQHCPWSLERYGGYAPYLRIFDRLPTGVSAGHCFPAGHASGGLWIPAIAAYWLPDQPAKALMAFLAGMIPGLALGWAQQMRGAHFLTHTLWAAWIASLIILVLLRIFLYFLSTETTKRYFA